ncbi:MAG: hypothetical protein R6V10_01935 [bacterium]
MLPGYNHNICYKGQIFHIQTEDSGVNNPHIITLLYKQGNIIARKKHDYSDIIGFDRLEDVLREMMQEQHKTMLRELKKGVHDQHLGLAPSPEEEAACEAAASQEAPVQAPPPPEQASEITEKPASKTITISEDEELKDEDIFGSDLISDKSLDEVILSFLSKEIDEDEEE